MLSDFQIERYCKYPACCPYCGSYDLDNEPTGLIETGELTSKIVCQDCKKSWTEFYKITGVIMD